MNQTWHPFIDKCSWILLSFPPDDEDERMSINVSMSSPGSAVSAPTVPAGSSASAPIAAAAGIMQPPSPVSRDQLQVKILIYHNQFHFDRTILWHWYWSWTHLSLHLSILIIHDHNYMAETHRVATTTEPRPQVRTGDVQAASEEPSGRK